MSKEKEQNSTEQKKPLTTTEREKEFNEAVERVYRRYGGDLEAFRQDVQRELLKRA